MHTNQSLSILCDTCSFLSLSFSEFVEANDDEVRKIEKINIGNEVPPPPPLDLGTCHVKW